MTKKLSDQAKKEKKEIRKQQKAASKTVKTVTQPKHEDPPAEPVNLCDDCAYEYGECEGKPKFASDQDETLTGPEADRVIECPAFVNVAAMPTAQEAAAPGPAAAEVKDQGEGPDAAHDGGDKGTAEAEEEPEPEVKVIRTDLPKGPDPKRFQAEEDFGACQSCERPLKRTAFNRYQDAVRCTNVRCRAYRAVVKTISSGVR